MSEETSAASRKQKKALRDAARRAGGKKRKAAEDDVPNLPEDIENEDAPIAADTPKDETKTAKKSKKRKHNVDETATETPDAGGDDSAQTAQPRRKKAKNSGHADNGAEGEGQPSSAPAKSRFIVFVGNLPYSTTDSTLRAHFSKLEPFTLRHRTDPKTRKSKGFAFLEFENYDRMKTCLKLYHHSMFDPEDKINGGHGKGTGRGGRRINVELTAGGGGKTEGRKEKIRVKNERLEEQRKRRAEEERKADERKAAKAASQGKKKGTEEARAAKEENAVDASSGIHPSRLAQMGAR